MSLPHFAADENEYTLFHEWWLKHAATLNSRATLVWEELAWSGWYARSEVAANRIPAVFERQGPSE